MRDLGVIVASEAVLTRFVRSLVTVLVTAELVCEVVGGRRCRQIVARLH